MRRTSSIESKVFGESFQRDAAESSWDTTSLDGIEEDSRGAVASRALAMSNQSLTAARSSCVILRRVARLGESYPRARALTSRAILRA